MKTMMRAAFVAATTAAVCLYGQSFTVADVHAVPSTADSVLIGAVPQTGRFELRGATMVDLIRTAWNVGWDRVTSGPSWLATDRFDVIAMAPPGSTRDAMKLMLQALLAERFKLVVHPGTSELPAFTMAVARSGVKMKKSEELGEGGCASPPNDGQTPGSGPSYVTYVCHGMTMDEFAKFLPGGAPAYFRGATPLVDQTHLEGAWDFSIKWTPRGQVASAGEDGIALFDGVEKQLGLHIELGKAPLPVVVVDSVNQKPTDNPPGVTEKLPERPKEFEVAVIKLSAPGSTQTNLSIKDDRVNVQGMTLKDLVVVSWDLSDDRVAGLPAFAENDRYDITAKTLPGAADFASMQTMLQALIKSRFRIVSHEENRPIDVLMLVASKPKLKKADPANRSQCQNVASTNVVMPRSVVCQNVTMAQFAAWLENGARGYVNDRPVLDATSVEGNWDFTLNFSNARAAMGSGGALNGDGGLADPNGAVSLFDAIEKQLGLKLETAKRPMPVMVIDHIEERPTEN